VTVRSRRIGLVIGQLGRGGAERQLATLALQLRRRGVEPSVFCLSSILEPFGSLLRDSGILLEVIPRLGPFDPSRVFRLARRFRRLRLDLAHSFLIDANLYVVLAAALSRVPAVVTSNLNSDFPRDPVRRRLDRLAFLSAGRVWVNSERVRNFTSAFFEVPEGRIAVVRQGVDTDRFLPADNRDEVRSGLGMPGGLVLGTVASLTEKKAPWLFLELAEGLLREFADLTVVHVGEGPLRPAVEAWKARSTVGERLRLLGPRDDIERILPALDVLLLSSVHEGLPNVILEAMACGLPVVAPNVGGCNELVRNGLSGLLVERATRDDLMTACRSLLADSALRQRFGTTARKIAVAEHSLTEMTDRMLAVYEAAGLRASS
jgi:glycosyltransferase involved in cell wall biosynthesis